MAKVIHVNGTSIISVGAQGTAGGLTELGLAAGGVDISFEVLTGDVYADSGGPSVPVDVQDFGRLAYITARLSIYDADVLEDLMTLAAASAAQEPSPGKLLIANNKCKRVVISSPEDARPWRFFYCHLLGQLELPKLGTVQTIPTVRFRALPGTGTAGTMAALPLFDHTAA